MWEYACAIGLDAFIVTERAWQSGGASNRFTFRGWIVNEVVRVNRNRKTSKYQSCTPHRPHKHELHDTCGF